MNTIHTLRLTMLNRKKQHTFVNFTFIASVTMLFITGCNSDTSAIKPQQVVVQEVAQLDEKLRTLITNNKITGDPTTGRTLPTIESPLSQLGMKLFYTKSLGGEFDAACVTCHHPMLGGGDDMSLSVGVDADIVDLLGPGRLHSLHGEHHDGGPTVPRNAPTTFNIAMWDNVLFHDGRVESIGKTPNRGGGDGKGIRTPDVSFGKIDNKAGKNLTEAQARFPVTSPEEMKNFTYLANTTNQEVRNNIAQRLGAYGEPLGGHLAVNNWFEAFQIGFDNYNTPADQLITFNNIVEAISEYENSQVFVETPFKAYVQGDDNALNSSQKKGAILFYEAIENGGANCVSCHSGDFFTDESFHAIGMPQIGRGKGDGINGSEDFGRFRETKNEIDKFAFRTPSLINVTKTGPWGHAGASTTLEHAIRVHADPQTALNQYDFSQLDSNIQINNMVANTQRVIDKININEGLDLKSAKITELSDEEITDLVAFLHALTDPCVNDRACLNKWIPHLESTSPDDFQVVAFDENGNYL